MNNVWDNYDRWKQTDTVGDCEWEEIYRREWVESLVRQEHPESDEAYISWLAAKRMAEGFYDTLDF